MLKLGEFYIDASNGQIYRCIADYISENGDKYCFLRKFDRKKVVFYGDLVKFNIKNMDLTPLPNTPKKWYYAPELWEDYV